MANNSGNFENSDLVGCVSQAVDQASSVISQMETQFFEGNGKLSDSNNLLTLGAIRSQLEDIKSVVNWHYDESNNDKES